MVLAHKYKELSSTPCLTEPLFRNCYFIHRCTICYLFVAWYCQRNQLVRLWKNFVHTDVSYCAKLKNFRIITSWMMTTNSSNTSIFSTNIHLLRYISVISFLATKYEDGYIFETTGYRKNYFLIGSVYQIASSIGQSCFYQPADGEKTEEKWSWWTNKFWRQNPSKGCKGSRAEKGAEVGYLLKKIFILVAGRDINV